LEIKLKGSHVDTIEVIDAESRLKMAETLGKMYTYRRELLRSLWWPVGPELASTGEIMNSYLYNLSLIIDNPSKCMGTTCFQ
jgi:hypothetical protein